MWYVCPSALIAFTGVNYPVKGHVFCNGCLSGIVEAAAGTSSSTIHCPTCRAPVSTSIFVCLFPLIIPDLVLSSHSKSPPRPAISTPLCSSSFPPHLSKQPRPQPCASRYRPCVKAHRRGRESSRATSHGERSLTTELSCMACPR
jgi:hypothetical protein